MPTWKHKGMNVWNSGDALLACRRGEAWTSGGWRSGGGLQACRHGKVKNFGALEARCQRTSVGLWTSGALHVRWRRSDADVSRYGALDVRCRHAACRGAGDKLQACRHGGMEIRSAGGGLPARSRECMGVSRYGDALQPCRHGGMKVWRSGTLKLWKRAEGESTWRNGAPELSGALCVSTWRYGALEARCRRSDLESWSYGALEMLWRRVAGV